MVCVVKGMTNREIADRLFLSTHTVVTHRRNIARKLQVHSASGLTVYAIVNKLVELKRYQIIIHEEKQTRRPYIMPYPVRRTFCTGTKQNATGNRIPDTYKLTNKSIYRKGWIDFNKNGKKDVYEDPTVPIDARVEDLLSQMNVEEKTCQMVTLYGYKRVLKDDLPTSDWKKQLWKDGIEPSMNI